MCFEDLCTSKGGNRLEWRFISLTYAQGSVDLLGKSRNTDTLSASRGKMMNLGEGQRDRPADGPDVLRKQIEEIREMTSALLRPPTVRTQTPDAGMRVVERIKAEMGSQLGFVPPLFASVMDSPEILAGLWQQMRFAYLNNPMPALTKEKLLARLSRSCPVRYALVAHSCRLRSLGMRAGEILHWLEDSLPTGEEDLEPFFARFASAPRPLPPWPKPGTPLEDALLACAIYLFNQPGRNSRCRDELCRFLGSANYARLISLLGYVRTHLTWLETCPEPDQASDDIICDCLPRLLEEEPGLAPVFTNAPEQQGKGLHAEGRILERLLQDNPDGIFAFSPSLACTLWNPAMERIFGIPEGEAVGRTLFDVLPFLVEVGADKGLLETLQGNSISVPNGRFRVPETGKEGFCDALYVPLINGEGRISGGLAFVRDTTERILAEQSSRATEERYLELFENAHDIVYTHDLDCHLTSINKAAERITGYTGAEALQMTAGDLVDPEQLKIACRTMERQIAGENPPPFELEIVCKDGRRVALEVSTHIISRDGRPVGVQGIARDISERKKTEEALQQAKQHLEAWVRELEQRTREMTLLSEMGDMLRACLTTDEAYTVIVRVAQQIFPVEAGALYVISHAHNLVEAVAVWGDASRVERAFALNECWALRRGRVHWVEDSITGLLCKHLPTPSPQSYLCVPMMAQSEALGILYLTPPADSHLTEPKQRLAVAMAEHIAMALSNLRLHETLRSQSIRDPLTGLFNRRFMEESLELELRRAARSRRPLGMIMVEIDNFKEVNRSLGGDAEGSILLELGGLLQTVIRREDVACRFDSEKFTIFLPQGSLETTARRAENLCEMIRHLDIRHRGRPVGTVTASAGVAAFPDQGRTVETLIRAAEGALQRAKQEGGGHTLSAQ